MNENKIKELKEKKEHQELLSIQIGAFRRDKKLLSAGKLKNSILIVQNFSLLEIQQAHQYQDLIIWIYFYDPQSSTGLSWKTFHFLPSEANVSNDISFVAEVWNYLMSCSFMETVETIYIWSDGGPKHFKMTGCLKLFHDLRVKWKKSIIYNFLNFGMAILYVMVQQPMPKKN